MKKTRLGRSRTRKLKLSEKRSRAFNITGSAPAPTFLSRSDDSLDTFKRSR